MSNKNTTDASKEIKSGVTKSGSLRYFVYDRIRCARWLPIKASKALSMLEKGDAVAYDPKANNLW